MAANAFLGRRAVLLGGAALLVAAGGAAVLTVGSGPAKAAGVIYKSPTCGCCSSWLEQMTAAGMPLEVEHPADLGAIKDRYGVAYSMSSCHTAVIDGYVVEGHVPIEHVRRLLDERPDVRGLAVPGMPAGSPGMESAGAEPYTVFLLRRDGSAAPFQRMTP